MACNSINQGDFERIIHSKSDINLDGIGNDEDWQNVQWKPINQVWLGALEDSLDFQGRYKLLWDDSVLMVLAEIVDDSLIDTHEDPLVRYWDDDCLELFIDEDNSKGIHQYNHSAFAYHIALDGSVADMGTDSIAHLYNDHIISKRITVGNLSTWEVFIKIYDDSFLDNTKNKRHSLHEGQQIGFAIAYCDNDKSKERETFIGSEIVEGEDKNKGWIDAGIFRSYELVTEE